MGLHWIRGPKVVVEVAGSEIVVTMPGTSLSVVYEKTEDNQLIANSFFLRGRTRNARTACQSFLPLEGKADRLDSVGRRWHSDNCYSR